MDDRRIKIAYIKACIKVGVHFYRKYRFLHQLGRTVGTMTSDVSDFLSCFKKKKILWPDVVSPLSVSVSGVFLLALSKQNTEGGNERKQRGGCFHWTEHREKRRHKENRGEESLTLFYFIYFLHWAFSAFSLHGPDFSKSAHTMAAQHSEDYLSHLPPFFHPVFKVLSALVCAFFLFVNTKSAGVQSIWLKDSDTDANKYWNTKGRITNEITRNADRRRNLIKSDNPFNNKQILIFFFFLTQGLWKVLCKTLKYKLCGEWQALMLWPDCTCHSR